MLNTLVFNPNLLDVWALVFRQRVLFESVSVREAPSLSIMVANDVILGNHGDQQAHVHRDANIDGLLISTMAPVLLETANVRVGGTACTDMAFDDDMDVERFCRRLAGLLGRLRIANRFKL